MFGLRYIKVGPTTYLLHFINGKVHREGAGLAFFYYEPNSTIVTIPLASVDVPFVFNEVSADYQAITVQGQLSYRVTDPKKTRRNAQLLRGQERPLPIHRSHKTR